MFVAQTTDEKGQIVTYRDNNRPVQPLHGRKVMKYAHQGTLNHLQFLEQLLLGQQDHMCTLLVLSETCHIHRGGSSRSHLSATHRLG
jgi:hypothetical protein